MAASTASPPERGGNRRQEDAGARAAAFRAARRHTFLVRALRVALPASAASALAALVVTAQASMPEGLSISIARTSISSSDIVMEQPRVSGFDQERREYKILAARATQKLISPQQVRLETIEAAVVTPDRGTVTIKAGVGDYDNNVKTLALAGGVRVASEDGYAMELEDVRVDFEAAELELKRPVKIIYKGGDTVGDALKATKGGRFVVLEGRVRTTIIPKLLRSPASAPRTASVPSETVAR